MLQATPKTITVKELNLLDLVMTGEASQLAGCDRRTFIQWAERLNVHPAASLKGGKLVYKREDVNKVVKAYKLSQSKKE